MVRRRATWFFAALVVSASACSSGTQDKIPPASGNRNAEANLGRPEVAGPVPTTGGATGPPGPTGPLCTGAEPGSRAAASAVAEPAVAAPPATGSDSAGAVGKASVAVVILMLPTDKTGAAHAADPRTYKLSLTANSQTATVEVDGQQIGTARVQRVYPEERDRRPPRPAFARPVRREIPSADSGDPGGRERPTSGPSELSYTHRPAFLNPNGAPIID
jgi:hypothetical protein